MSNIEVIQKLLNDIDCGCSAKGKRDGAKLACIRLDDEQIYYI